MTWQIKAGDARAVLAGEAAGSVQTVCTSPPYFGLRSYQTEGQIWGGAPDCDHVWGEESVRALHDNLNAGFNERWGNAPGARKQETARPQLTRSGVFCLVLGCGAWRGELGGEPTVDLYVAHLVDVFRAVRRVLRPDGTCWVNLGDSFARSSMGGGTGKHSSLGGTHHAQRTGTQPLHKPVWDLGEKQLLLVPARFALAMQADGWILRQAITWCKTAPMPESVQDRPTSATEMIYLFSQQPRYYFDAAAIAEPTMNGENFHGGYIGSGNRTQARNGRADTDNYTSTRNAWNYWLIGPAPSSLPHYAMFPPEIPRRCILAGTSAYGACSRCGAPWRRQTERERQPRGDAFGRKNIGDKDHGQAGAGYQETIRLVTTGWAPGCQCGAAVVPCKVLDPFSGAGTTIQEAARLGRDGLGIELLPANVELSRRRIIADCPLFNAPQEATA